MIHAFTRANAPQRYEPTDWRDVGKVVLAAIVVATAGAALLVALAVALFQMIAG